MSDHPMLHMDILDPTDLQADSPYQRGVTKLVKTLRERGCVELRGLRRLLHEEPDPTLVPIMRQRAADMLLHLFMALTHREEVVGLIVGEVIEVDLPPVKPLPDGGGA